MDTVPGTTRLTIVITSRTFSNIKVAMNDLKKYYAEHHPARPALIEFDYLCVDLADMVSVAGAVRELEIRFNKIDWLFLNAALALYDGIDWIQAAKDTLKSPYNAFTYAHYKRQRPVKPTADGMGSVFQANVFAPWYLVRRLTSPRQTDPIKLEVAPADLPLLRKGSKVFWVSSLTADSVYYDPVVEVKGKDQNNNDTRVSTLRFDTDDMQLLRTAESYEASKREIDLLHHATAQMLKDKYGVVSLLVQPGIFKSTSFSPTLNVFAYFGMMLAFYMCRWFWGSNYHNIDPWKAAYAFVELAKDEPDVDAGRKVKKGKGKNQNISGTSTSGNTSEKKELDLFVKYGSATSRSGKSFILQQPVPGLDNGYSSKLGSEMVDQEGGNSMESSLAGPSSSRAVSNARNFPNSSGQAYKVYLYVEGLYNEWNEKLKDQVIERYLF